MSKQLGRDVIIEFAIAQEDATYETLSFSVLGMMRDKGMEVAWDKADATADDSPDFTKEAMTTFKEVKFNGSGVSRNEAVYNQATLKAHIYTPGAGTDYMPKVWLRQTAHDGVTYGPFLFDSHKSSAPYADAITWEISATSNGAVTFVPA